MTDKAKLLEARRFQQQDDMNEQLRRIAAALENLVPMMRVGPVREPARGYVGLGLGLNSEQNNPGGLPNDEGEQQVGRGDTVAERGTGRGRGAKATVRGSRRGVRTKRGGTR